MKSSKLNNSNVLAMLASTALLMQGAAALASDTEYAQTQAQHLLGGRPMDRSRLIAIVDAARTHSQSSIDPQEQARRLILGSPRTSADSRQGDGSRPVSALHGVRSGKAPASLDGQALAQRMILGAG